MSKKYYFVGICGGALSSLAQLLVARGEVVAGSDLNAASEMGERLQKKGITVYEGHDPAHITADISAVVISSAVVAGPGAAEVERARELGIPVFKRTELWRQLSGQAKVAIAVAGSHGKTSTTAMIGFILAQAGLDPTVLVGGDVPDFTGNVRVGSPDVLVIEADEYDRAFLSLRPTLGVITNIDYDHPDTYPTPKEYQAAFRRFARKVRDRQGRVVMNGNDKYLRQTFARWKHSIIWYSGDKPWPGLRVQTPGRHMLTNAMAAAKACHELGIPTKTIKQALQAFRGVSRRFEYLGKLEGLEVYDDFAHHPTELAANISTARDVWGKVAVIFQPHQSVRTALFAKEFAAVLDEADKIALVPLYKVAGREEGAKADESDIIKSMKKDTRLVSTASELEEFARECKQAGFDHLLVMGAGTISNLTREAITT